MKRLIFSIALFSFFISCEEIPPLVTGSMGPVEPPAVSEQKRQVLVEEFTGVRCVNCPAGSAIIEDLLVANSPQLIAVSIHAGDFSIPYSQSLYDFTTTEGSSILSYVGEPFGYPTAVVNRKKFDGEFDLQLGQAQWAGFVLQEKAPDPVVKIDIEPSFDAASRDLQVKVKLFVQEEIAEPDVRLSIMITESGIQDYQLTPASPDPKPDYVHKHVLRGMLTPYDGVPLTETLSAGAVVSKTFDYVLPAGWKEENCKVIAFISLAGEKKDVLQAHEVEVIE